MQPSTEVDTSQKGNSLSSLVTDPKKHLQKLVAKLPEIYQPIYQHPELSSQASRRCDDRLAAIKKLYRLLEKLANRPLRVLDLGCAQGFFSLSLAEMGATTVGVDFNSYNIDVCQALINEHPDYKSHFTCARVQNVIDALLPDQFDLVLGLSVFHHLVHAKGQGFVEELLKQLAEKVTVGIFEMAGSGEPAEWASSQPENPRQLLKDYAFVHEFAHYDTHLSALKRPMYVASNRCWFLNEHAGVFIEYQKESHPYVYGRAARQSRRYFFGQDYIVKQFTKDDDVIGNFNMQEYNHALTFLSSPPQNFKVPKLYAYGQNENESWLIREKFPGVLLSQMIKEEKPYDAKKVLCDVLKQLVILEAAGLYHSDVRTWNTLIQPDGQATLIDYGAISQRPMDCVWPYNVYLSFIIYVYEVTHSVTTTPFPLRTPALNPDRLAEPYRSILWEMMDSAPIEWRFATLYERFSDERPTKIYNNPSMPRDGLVLALLTLEEACWKYQSKFKIPEPPPS